MKSGWETLEHKEAYAWLGGATDNFKGKTPATITVLVIVFNTHIASNFILLKMKGNLLLGCGVENLTLAEAVELRGSRDGVGSHVLEVEPVASLHEGQARLGRDAVNAVAGGAPDRGVAMGLS